MERKILNHAFNFGFLNNRELQDMERLREDRNPCAHPAFVTDKQLFEPTPELVRTHITHAIIHLLRHTPMQGKKAIESIIAEIRSENFPINREDIFNYLKEEYLTSQPKEELMTALIIEVLNELFKEKKDSEAKRIKTGITYTLLALEKIQHKIYQQTIQEELSNLIDKSDRDQLMRIFWLRKKGERCWEIINSKSRTKVERVLSEYLEEDNVHEIFYSYDLFDSIDIINEDSRLKKSLLEKFSLLDRSKQETVVSRTQYAEFTDIALEIYAEINDVNAADKIGEELIIPLAPYFSKDQVKIIVYEFRNNPSVFQAEKTPQIILRFFDKVTEHFDQTKGYWVSLMKYIQKDTQEKDKSLEDEYVELRQKLSQKLREEGATEIVF